MEVYDQAHALARSLARSGEYNDFRLARAKIESSPASMDMLRDFRRRQLELEMALLSGKEPDQALQQSLEESYRIISLNPSISAYLEAEARLARLLADIQKIIFDAIPAWSKDAGADVDKDSSRD